MALDLAPRTRAERELLALILNTARAHLDLRLGAGDAPPQSSLESLQRYLFSGDAVPPRDEDGSVAIFSTSGEALECVEIARRIGDAVDAACRFDQIAIPVRSPERYQPLVVEGSASRRNSGPLHARLAAARRRRTKFPRAAALCGGAPLRLAIRGVSLARPDARGRGTAHAGRLGAPAGGRRGDRRPGPLGRPAWMDCARSFTAAIAKRRTRRTRTPGAPHRVRRESARASPCR